MTAQELIAKVLGLEKDFDDGSDVATVDLAESAPTLARIADLAIGRLKGHAESSLYDEESKWASGVLTELDRIAKGEE